VRATGHPRFGTATNLGGNTAERLPATRGSRRGIWSEATSISLRRPQPRRSGIGPACSCAGPVSDMHQRTRVGLPARLITGRVRIVVGSGPRHRAEIFVMNADGSSLTRLTNHILRGSSTRVVPGWCNHRLHKQVSPQLGHLPDGFGRTRQRRFTRSSARDSNPDWSPDGTRMVHQSIRHRNLDDL
jgi:hypothetical protein